MTSEMKKKWDEFSVLCGEADVAEKVHNSISSRRDNMRDALIAEVVRDIVDSCPIEYWEMIAYSLRKEKDAEWVRRRPS